MHCHMQVLRSVLGNQVLFLCHLSSPYFIILDVVISGIEPLFDMVLFKRVSNFSHLLTAWGGYMCTIVYIWSSEDCMQEWVFFFCHRSPQGLAA